MLKVKVIHRIYCAAPRCKLGGDQRYPVSFQDPPCSSAPRGAEESGVFPSSTLGSTLGSIPRSSCRPGAARGAGTCGKHDPELLRSGDSERMMMYDLGIEKSLVVFQTLRA